MGKMNRIHELCQIYAKKYSRPEEEIIKIVDRYLVNGFVDYDNNDIITEILGETPKIVAVPLSVIAKNKGNLNPRKYIKKKKKEN